MAALFRARAPRKNQITALCAGLATCGTRVEPVSADVPFEQARCAMCIDLIATGDVSRFSGPGPTSDPEKFLDAATCFDRFCQTSVREGAAAEEATSGSFGGASVPQAWSFSFLREGLRKFWASRHQPVVPAASADIRVAPGYGSRDYGTVRVSVISEAHGDAAGHSRPGNYRGRQEPRQKSSRSVTFEYSAPFKWAWPDFHLQTGLHYLTPGEHVETEILPNLSATLFYPQKGRGVSGVLIGDPCVNVNNKILQPMKCAEGDNWRLQDYWPQLVNAFVGRDSNTQFWGLLGDNFYDRDGSVTDFAFGRSEKSGLWLRTRCDCNYQLVPAYGLSLETKAKLFLTVPGNHDYWLEGAPVRATSQDQCGNGFVQYYGQDVKAAVDLEGVSTPAPYDLSIDPVIPGNPKLCAYTARENSFFYNVVGNVGFIGYSAVHSWESQKADFATACATFFADSDVDLVFVLGHWNKQGAGTVENTDMMNTTRLVVESFPSTCGALHEEGRVTFAMGHEHCAHPVVNNYMTSGSTAARTGFLVGSFGMDDWVCPDYTTAYDAPPENDAEVAQDQRRSPHTYGFPVFSTEGNRFTVWYFLLKRNGNGKESGVDYFDEVLNCLQFERTWKLCTHLAVLWHERELPPRRSRVVGEKKPADGVLAGQGLRLESRRKRAAGRGGTTATAAGRTAEERGTESSSDIYA